MKKRIEEIIKSHFQTTMPYDAERCADEILKVINQKEEKENKKNKLILQCDCSGMEFMEWLVFEDDREDGIYVSYCGTEIYGLWRRLKMAWKIIRYGEYNNDGILLNNEKDKLIEWLKNLE